MAGLALAAALSGCSMGKQEKDMPKSPSAQKVGDAISAQFDELLLPFQDKGYFVKADGKIGYIDLTGSWKVQPEAISLEFNRFDDFESVEPETSQINACLGYLAPDAKEGKYEVNYPQYQEMAGELSGETPSETPCDGYGNGAGIHEFRLNENMELHFYRSARGMYVSGIEALSPEEWNEANLLESYPVVPVRKEFKQNTQYSSGEISRPYYLYNTSNDEIYGPYDHSEQAYFNVGSFGDDHAYYVNSYTRYLVASPFYTKEENGLRIWKNDKSKSYPELFDSARPISAQYMLVKKGNKTGILNNEMQLLVWGEFEDVLPPVNGNGLVKEDGIWKLIQISYPENYNEDLNKETDSNESGKETGV